MSDYHESVLLKEAIEALRVRPGGKYIDATVGGGGHSFAISELGGEVLGIDVDEEAIGYIESSSREVKKKILITLGNFRDIDLIAKEKGFNKVDGILFDFGVSSYQLNKEDRGFSFRTDTLLDMRMSKSLSVTAKDLVNGLTKKELYELITKFGEDHFARRISEAIVRSRLKEPIKSTLQLSQIVKRVVPIHIGKIHPATKLFQALRIAVNDELNSIKIALPKCIDLLKSGSRIACISFHSLEDRIVKRTFIDWEAEKLGIIISKKPIIPSVQEIEANSRSRSAKLRIFEKL